MAILEAMGEIGEAMINRPQAVGDPGEQLTKVIAGLSEHLVARALAEESLAIIDQVASDEDLHRYCSRHP